MLAQLLWRKEGLVQGSTGRLFHLVQDLIVAAGRRRGTLIIRSTCDGHFVYHNAILIRRRGWGEWEWEGE